MATMTSPAERLRELGRLVKRRRLALDWTQEYCADTAGMSRTTWSNLEKGVQVNDLARAKAERLLGYQPGTFDAYIEGGTQPVTREQRLEWVIAATDANTDIDWGNDNVRELINREARDALRKLRDREATAADRDNTALG